MLGFSLLLAVLHACVLSTLAEKASLENKFVRFEFDSELGLTGLIDKKSGLDAVGSSAGSVSTWEIQLVDKVGELSVSLSQESKFSARRDDDRGISSLLLSWNNIDVKRNESSISNVNVTLNLDLSDTSSIAEWELGLAVNSGDSIGVWEGVVSIPLSIASDKDGELFYPSGFGHIFAEPASSTGGNFASTYPGGMCTMQFMAMGNTAAKSGVYVSALDPTGQAKGLQYSTFASSTQPAVAMPAHGAHGHARRAGKKLMAPVRRWRSDAKEGAAALSYIIYPPNAGVAIAPGETWTAPYRLAVGVLQDVSAAEGRPLWAEAAQVYRHWALQHAEWVKAGTLAQRAAAAAATAEKVHTDVPSAAVPPMPAWYRANTLWLNTHWQCHDIFNTTGGDPHFVLPYTLEVADRLRGSDPDTPRSLALHWYEWQQGPDPSPDARYLFDTHYPDYFPSRTDFKAAVKALRAAGIQTFPYINGRISDVNSDAYLHDNGAQYCSKAAPAKLIDAVRPEELTAYVETYGSNATFCVTNPFTAYWQQKLADTVRELVEDYGCPGVYIDQVGSAIPKLCWDSSHGHTLGGGNFWVTGYQAMMDAIAGALYGQKEQGDRRPHDKAVGYPMVTEDNAEPYMSMVQGLLTLDAYKTSLAQAATSATPPSARMAPAYPMIYGGYYTGFGAIWTRADFADHDWWCSKLASMLVTGSQLGWFSLAGVNDDPQESCGPMGVGDLFLDPASDDLVAFLQLLQRSRASLVDYLSDGALLRPPSLLPAPTVGVFTSTFDGSQSAYDTVLVQAWRLPAAASVHHKEAVMVVVANVAQVPYSGTVEVRPANWGLSATALSAAAMNVRDFTAAGAVGASEDVHVQQQQDTPVDTDGTMRVPVRLQGRSVKVLEWVL